MVAADTAAAVVVTMQALARCIPSYALTAARTLPFRSGPEATVRSTVVTASRNGAGEHPPHADSRSRRGRRPPPPVPETPLGTGAATASVTWALSAEVRGRAPCVWRATARQLAAAGPEPAATATSISDARLRGGAQAPRGRPQDNVIRRLASGTDGHWEPARCVKRTVWSSTPRPSKLRHRH